MNRQMKSIHEWRQALLIILFLIGKQQMDAQLFIKTDYTPSSRWIDKTGKKSSASGDMKTIKMGISIPLFQKINDNGRPTLWSINAGGAYAAMNNRNFNPTDTFPSHVLNTQLGLMFVTPISEKWSLFSLAGAGIYTDTSEPVSGKNFLMKGGVIFVRHTKINIDWGLGVVLNNMFGYPMVFPSFYFDWQSTGRFQFKVSMVERFEVSAGMRVRKNLNLNLGVDMQGMTAFVERNDESVMCGQMQIVAGLKPEYTLGRVVIQGTIGASLLRTTEYQKRSLKGIFKGKPDDESDPRFVPTGYFSLGIRYHFGK